MRPYSEKGDGEMRTRTALGAVAASALLLVGGGAAVAASGDTAPRARCEARLLARIDAAEKAGRISTELAARLRQRVSGGRVCARLHHRVTRIAAHSMVRAAASFLGLDREELREQLPGTSLAALARKQGKTVAALEAAMLAPAKERLATAVANGAISQERADEVLDRLENLAERLATKEFPQKS
jgi:hypothetical protein